ncbi:hypothetical protein CDEF62S_03455 [Castellaniella defragrans]
MNDNFGNSKGISRRGALKMAATMGVATIAGPKIVMAAGEQPVKLGVDNPLTGTYAITGRNELHGMELAVEEINAKGGILGRPAKLIVEDSTSGDAGVAVQKARKLIDKDKVDFLVGNVNSGLTMAMSAVAYEKGVFMMDPRAGTRTPSRARSATGTSTRSTRPPRCWSTPSPLRWSSASARSSTSWCRTMHSATGCSTPITST